MPGGNGSGASETGKRLNANRLDDIGAVQRLTFLRFDERFIHVAVVVVRGSDEVPRLLQVGIQHERSTTGCDRGIPVELPLASDRGPRKMSLGQIGILLQRSTGLGLGLFAPSFDFAGWREPKVHVR